MKSQSQTGWLSKQRQRRIFSLPRCVRKAKAQKLVRKNYKESKLTGSPVAPAEFHLNITGKHNDNSLDYTMILLHALHRPHGRAIRLWEYLTPDEHEYWVRIHLQLFAKTTLHTWHRKTTLPMVTHLYSPPLPQRHHKPSVTVLIFTFSPKDSSCSGFAVNISTEGDLDAPIRSRPLCKFALSLI